MERPKVTSTSPLFVVSDLERSIDFYCGKLGFREPSIWGEPPCFAMINRDRFEIMLSLAEDAAHVRPNGPQRIWDVYINVADLDAELMALKEAGVPLDLEAHTTEYDMIEAEVVDPDGYRICFAQSLT